MPIIELTLLGLAATALLRSRRRQRCINCNERFVYDDETSDDGYCSQSCLQEHVGGISEISSQDPSFKSVADQFTNSWRHPTAVPEVYKIYKVRVPERASKAYFEYREFIEEERNLSYGNQRRRWHGTKRTCHLGDYGNTNTCNDISCCLCSIIRGSFDMECLGRIQEQEPGKFERFGDGLYASSTSSKSADYSINMGQASGSAYRALLLNAVVVGKGYKLYYDQQDLTSPPEDYDSVLGEPSSSGDLNYDEVVVYRSDAIIPVYLVIFED